MNWTEGNLVRHSRNRKRKDTLLRQKEHFAKVRSGLLNANLKTSPPSISIFANTARSNSPVSCRSSKSIPSIPSRKRSQENGLLETSHYFKDASLGFSDDSSFQKEQVGEDALSRKRQKLLMKSDWVGTTVQKPIRMDFSKPRQSLGNPWGGSRPHRHSSRQRLRSLLGLMETSGGQPRIPNAAMGISTPISRSQLKIRVGSVERTLGVRSNISSGGRSYREDSSGSRVEHDHVPKQRSHKKQHTRQYNSPRLGLNSRAHQSSDDSSQPRALTPPPLLHHPIPYRFTCGQLLRSQSTGSETAASTMAQVGVQKPEITSSQRDDNEAWRQFVNEPGISQTLSNWQPSEAPSEPLISPSISQLNRSGRPDTFAKNKKNKNPSPVAANGVSIVHHESLVQLFEDLSSPTTRLLWERQGEKAVSEESAVQPLTNRMWADQPAVKSFPEIPHGEDITVPEENRLGSLDPNTPQWVPSLENAEEIDHGNTQRPTDDPDGLSLLVIPTSPEVSSEDNQSVSNILLTAPIQKISEKNDGASMLQGAERGSINHSKEAEQGTTKRIRLPKPCTPRNENDMWRKFVFGESDENFEDAIEDARKQTTKNLRPSLTPTSGNENEEFGGNIPHVESGEDLKLLESLQNDFDVGIRDSMDRSSDNISTTVSASYQATAGDTSSDQLSDNIPLDPDTAFETSQSIYGLSNLPRSRPLDLASEFMSRSDEWSSITNGRNSPLTITPTPTSGHGKLDISFKFTQPELSFGKKTGASRDQGQITLPARHVRGKTRVSRRQKRTSDGRITIRELPGFDGDPIEEFEEDIPAKWAQRPSLFGSLETGMVFES